MIFVVIRPNTNAMVRQKRTRWFSSISVECGESSQALTAMVNVIIGVHSRNTGATGRLSLRRARTTLSTQKGICVPKSVRMMIPTQTSRKVKALREEGKNAVPKKSVSGCVQIAGPKCPASAMIMQAMMRPSVGPLMTPRYRVCVW